MNRQTILHLSPKDLYFIFKQIAEYFVIAPMHRDCLAMIGQEAGTL